MSADLLAAFGIPNAPTDPNEGRHEKKQALNDPSNVLLPGFETVGILHHDPQKAAVEPNQRGEHLWHHDGKGTHVLFDAAEDEEELEDDFGDFEDVEASLGNNDSGPGDASAAFPDPNSQHVPVAQAGENQPGHDLLGLDEEETNTTDHSETLRPHASAPTTSTFEKMSSTSEANDDWGDFSDPVVNHVPQRAKEAATKAPQMPLQPSVDPLNIAKDDWESFEDGEVAGLQPQSESTMQRTKEAASQPAVPALQQTPAQAVVLNQQPVPGRAEDIRPSNIPPPAILLQLLPRVLGQLRQTTTSLSNQDQHIAAAIIQAFTVSARLIAGRSLRWKRDTILSQSMRIGPATSGGGRGMKLTAIDKSESLKEEKEATDVVSIWEKNAHLFNTSIAKAGIQRPLMALSLNMKPRLESGISMLKAPHACALCGIKRDERVPQIDLRIEDSFGEFWVEHWGHRDCRDFWSQYKDILSQR